MYPRYAAVNDQNLVRNFKAWITTVKKLNKSKKTFQRLTIEEILSNLICYAEVVLLLHGCSLNQRAQILIYFIDLINSGKIDFPVTF